jgi:hypothetical protein
MLGIGLPEFILVLLVLVALGVAVRVLSRR